MKFFNKGSNKINCFCNLFVSLLCTSCLFNNYYSCEINNEIQHGKTAEIIENDMEVASQLGKKGNKVTLIVTKKDVNTSNKKYTPAKYDEVTGTAVVDYAKKYLGLRYVSGGNSLTTGTDCSGFTKLIYKEFGVSLSRTVKTQVKNGSYVKKSDLQKGDLVFYGYGNGVVRHVAIYMGNGKVIHESNHRDGVKISSLNMMEYITARRVINSKAIEIATKQEKDKVDNNNSNVINGESNVNNNTTNTNNDNVVNNNTNLPDSNLDNNKVDNVTSSNGSDSNINDSNIDENVYTSGQY